MTPAVQSMVAATYVRDIDTSRAFYELLGFHEQSAGKAATSAWSRAERAPAGNAGRDPP
jgi:predicted lactoylglutathione lyase